MSSENVTETTIKVIESDSAEGLSDLINEHLSLDYQIAGNNFQVTPVPENINGTGLLYSLMMMRVMSPVDPEVAEIYETK